MRDILQTLDRNQPEMLALAERLVRQESPTHDKAATDGLARVLSKELIERIDGSVDLIANEHYGDHLRMTCGRGETHILILGHFDTVHDHGALDANPFRVEGGRAYGPGILDMKAGIAQTIFAIEAVQTTGWLKTAQLTFLLNADEEIGSPTSEGLIRDAAREADICFVIEPGAGPDGHLKSARKAVGTYRLRATGLAAHAGLNPADGANAIEEISRQVLRLQALNDNRQGVTVNCGLIRGGASKNTVPETAEVTVDVRAPDQSAVDWIDAEIRRTNAADSRAKIAIEGGMTRPPMPETDAVRKLVKTAQRLMCDAGRQIDSAAVGGASDANFAAQHVPTLDGLGAVGAGAHTKQEYIETAFMAERSALLAALIGYAARKEFTK